LTRGTVGKKGGKGPVAMLKVSRTNNGQGKVQVNEPAPNGVDVQNQPIAEKTPERGMRTGGESWLGVRAPFNDRMGGQPPYPRKDTDGFRLKWVASIRRRVGRTLRS